MRQGFALRGCNQRAAMTTIEEIPSRKPKRMSGHSLSRQILSAELAANLLRTGHVRADARWTMLDGGRTNRLWHVDDPRGPRVVKLYDTNAATPLFRNDPAAEALVLSALHETGLAPRLIGVIATERDPILIYRHQPGHAWRTGTEPVARTLKVLHATVLDDDLRTLPRAPDGSAALMRQAHEILSGLTAAQARQLPPPVSMPDVPPSGLLCLLHGDPVPDNLICPADDQNAMPVLIDWQCPAIGDPVLDLALFLSPAMQTIGRGRPLSSTERQAFLSAYGNPAISRRLDALQPLLHWRMAAYCLWKIHHPRPDPAYRPALEAELAALSALSD